MILDLEAIKARAAREQIRITKAQTVFAMAGKPRGYIEAELHQQGRPHIPGLVNRLLHRKTLTATQFYNVVRA